MSSTNDTDIPVIPVAPDGCCMEPAVFAAWLSSQVGKVDALVLDALPPDNEIIPAMCATFGITRLVHALPGLPAAFRWRSPDGIDILVHAAGGDEVTDSEALPVHSGPLPPTATSIRSFRKHYRQLVQLVRLQDAQAVLDPGQIAGNDWATLLDLLDERTRPVAPSFAAQAQSFPTDQTQLAVWNPLPLRRNCLLRLDVNEATPWSFRLPSGHDLPVQLVEGARGKELLLQMPLEPLACDLLTAGEDPASTCHWEVTDRVLDNGRTRLELDDQGRVERLSLDGWFAPLASGFADVALSPESETVWHRHSVSVLEDGPVRSRLVVSRHCDAGHLRTTYSLHAGDPHLHVHIAWQAADPASASDCSLCLPLSGERSDLQWWPHWGEERRLRLVPDLFGAAKPYRLHGVDRLMLRSHNNGPALGLAHIDHRQILIDETQGSLALPIDDGLSLLFCACREGGDLAAVSLGATAGARLASDTSLVSDAPFHLYDNQGLQAIWIRRDPSGRQQLLLAELTGTGGVAQLVLPSDREPELLQAGSFVAMQAAKDDNTWRLPFAPGVFLLVSW